MVRQTAVTLGIVAWLLANAALPASAQQQQPQQQGSPAARALATKAIAANDIQTRAASPFRLEADMQVHMGGGQLEKGKLLHVWTPVGWRHDEQVLAGYQNIDIYGGRQSWTFSTAKYLPFPLFLARRALGLSNWLRQAHAQNLAEPATSSTGEICATTLGRTDPLTYCFDPLNGYLTQVADQQWNVSFRYSDYSPFGTKNFPRLIEVLRSNQQVFIEIHVVRLTDEKATDLRLFLPVKGAQEVPNLRACGGVQAAKLLKMVRPKYPKAAADLGIIGLVRLYADIGTDGVPRGMWPVNSSTPLLTQAAIEAVRQWRYQPRTCKTNGAPLRQTESLSVVFSPR